MRKIPPREPISAEAFRDCLRDEVGRLLSRNAQWRRKQGWGEVSAGHHAPKTELTLSLYLLRRVCHADLGVASVAPLLWIQWRPQRGNEDIVSVAFWGTPDEVWLLKSWFDSLLELEIANVFYNHRAAICHVRTIDPEGVATWRIFDLRDELRIGRKESRRTNRSSLDVLHEFAAST